ncbi:IclR family transcriptional regulator C-terminal domain-containing protein [Allopusillimonas ginsengisoli]|uniref:IclR family transcriptional regulator domain-containing protein n=1 Tax=Allopusillimonas ginsengisoli TaxID=453575 RepID=UPI0010C1BF81|nr:winged helix-turn-helix transcriptional regulator [Allopusillimonas ginsengisoli]
MASPESESFVRTFARGLQVIESLGRNKPEMNIAELAEATGLSRSVIKRYVLTLTELGYTSTNGRSYGLTPKVLNLGLSYLYSLPFWRQAQLELEELSQVIKQSCAMSILDENEIVYVVRIPTYKILRASPTLGSRLPANVVSMGRALLAESSETVITTFLEEAPLKRLTSQTITDKAKLHAELLRARSQGYAWVDAELDEAICGLAVTIKDLDGKALAAINVSLPSGQITEEEAVEKYLIPLRATASNIRSAL